MKNLKNYKGYALYMLLTCFLCVGCDIKNINEEHAVNSFKGAQYGDTSENVSINYELLNIIDYLKNNNVKVNYVDSFKKMEYVIFRHECIFIIGDAYFKEPLKNVYIYMNYTENYIQRVLGDAAWYVGKRIEASYGTKKPNNIQQNNSIAIGCGSYKTGVNNKETGVSFYKDTSHYKGGVWVAVPTINNKETYTSFYENDSNYKIGVNNILIGAGAGAMLTNESFCVIVGHDSIAKNISGKDMIWHVDLNEPSLNDCIIDNIKVYIELYINKGKDTKENRIKLINAIRDNYDLSIEFNNCG